VSKEYAARRSALIDMDKAQCDPKSGRFARLSRNTIYLRHRSRGNIVSLIQSLYLCVRSGVVVDGMGFPLQNPGALFELDQGIECVGAPQRPFPHDHSCLYGERQYPRRLSDHGGLNQAQAMRSLYRTSSPWDEHTSRAGGARFTES